MHIHYFRKSVFLILAFLFLNSCKLSDVDARKTPTNALERARKNVEEGKSTVFGYYVNDPERYGVAEFDTEGNVTSIEEKPRSSSAVRIRSSACS